MNDTIVALIYDFDKTLSPRDAQEYGFIPGIGMESKAFWRLCNDTGEKYDMDPMLAYMLVMLEQARGKMPLTRGKFRELGKSVKLFEGTDSWFGRVNAYADQKGVSTEHYIVSSGLREILEGTAIAKEFKEIYGSGYCYDENGIAFWPATVVNYIGKTQFIFRINKGALDASDYYALNEHVPRSKRRVQFENMIYIGDGYSDIPCMKIVKENGGHSIAVYERDRSSADRMMLDSRIDFTARADYGAGAELERIVFAVLDKIAAEKEIHEMSERSLESAGGAVPDN